MAAAAMVQRPEAQIAALQQAEGVSGTDGSN
jgi:hypothetical protein